MPDITSPETTGTDTKATATNGGDPAKARFAKAIDEAKAGAHALKSEAQGKAGAYREQFGAKSSEWIEEAKVKGDEAKVRATELANEGKARAGEAICSLGKIVEDNAATIDEKIGVKYGDYARTAAKSMQDAGTRIGEKDLDELGEDVKEFVRQSPGVAIGIAAAGGFLLARLFRRNN
jgi:ElaB/YqjD/DUF883 family membrane-anchored ribosome-binding protein